MDISLDSDYELDELNGEDLEINEEDLQEVIPNVAAVPAVQPAACQAAMDQAVPIVPRRIEARGTLHPIPDERIALNLMVFDYLVRHGYKRSSQAFYEENPQENVEDLPDDPEMMPPSLTDAYRQWVVGPQERKKLPPFHKLCRWAKRRPCFLEMHHGRCPDQVVCPFKHQHVLTKQELENERNEQARLDDLELQLRLEDDELAEQGLN